MTTALLLLVLAQQPPAVAPGSLVRWPGPATRCLSAGREVAPTAGECLFAIDLFRAPGPLTLGREREGRLEEITVTVEPSPYPVERITLPDDRYVRPSAKELARAERERRELEKVFARVSPGRFRLPLSHPLSPLPHGRNFGVKRVFNGEERSPHAGTDYPAANGTPVLAAEDGVVVLSARFFFAGRILVVDHGGGLFTSYIHLSKALVKSGTAVRRGQRIALSGATGRVSGPHLHFGVRWQEARVDPELLFRAPQELPALP